MGKLNTDKYFMKRALKLAEKAAGQTSPNPLVGTVVVKNGKIVGEGFHMKAGLPHAEIIALQNAKEKTKGAILYVNLEPCNHFGKTPPCTDAIISSGIKEVIIGMRDPNPINNGKGLSKLKRNGIKTKEGVLRKEAEILNRSFTKYVTKRMPYVTVKVAQSLDGKIATKTGDSKWISNQYSRRYVHQLRSRVDAVLVGINTILKDDPLLTSRIATYSKHQPKKIILDPLLKIPYESKLLKKPHSVIMVTTKKASKTKCTHLQGEGVDVIITKNRTGYIDLRTLMRCLVKRGVVNILVEGGGNTIARFLKKGLVDEILFFMAAKIIGGQNALTSVEGEGIKFVKQAIPIKDIKIKRFGNDILIQGKPIYR